jgi:hypothetical protein
MIRNIRDDCINKSFNCEVFQAANRSKVSFASNRRPHLIVLDYTMPLMDGAEVFEGSIEATEEYSCADAYRRGRARKYSEDRVNGCPGLLGKALQGRSVDRTD